MPKFIVSFQTTCVARAVVTADGRNHVDSILDNVSVGQADDGTFVLFHDHSEAMKELDLDWQPSWAKIQTHSVAECAEQDVQFPDLTEYFTGRPIPERDEVDEILAAIRARRDDPKQKAEREAEREARSKVLPWVIAIRKTGEIVSTHRTRKEARELREPHQMVRQTWDIPNWKEQLLETT